MKALADFLKHLFSDSNKAQLQNVCGFITVLALLTIAFINQWFSKPIEEFIFESLVILAVSCLGVTALTTFKSFKSKPEATTDDSTNA